MFHIDQGVVYFYAKTHTFWCSRWTGAAFVSVKNSFDINIHRRFSSKEEV